MQLRFSFVIVILFFLTKSLAVQIPTSASGSRFFPEIRLDRNSCGKICATLRPGSLYQILSSLFYSADIQERGFSRHKTRVTLTILVVCPNGRPHGDDECLLGNKYDSTPLSPSAGSHVTRIPGLEFPTSPFFILPRDLVDSVISRRKSAARRAISSRRPTPIPPRPSATPLSRDSPSLRIFR